MPKFKEANKLADAEFYERHIRPAVDAFPIEGYCIRFESSTSLSDPDFETCFKLLESTSANDYKYSGKGWSPASKKREMRDPLMKYLLLRKETDDLEAGSAPSVGQIVGFLSFMLTEENTFEVIYCYEIHLMKEARGKGFGKILMRTMESIGASVPVEQAMLTVFTSNQSAEMFYEYLGYLWCDEEPQPPKKKLRGRKVEAPEPSYIIMSKDLLRLRMLQGKRKQAASQEASQATNQAISHVATEEANQDASQS